MLTGSINMHHVDKIDIDTCEKTAGNNYDTMTITLTAKDGSEFEIHVFGDSMKNIEITCATKSTPEPMPTNTNAIKQTSKDAF